MFAVVMILANIALSVVSCMGIYGFTSSYAWAIIGMCILTGASMQVNPLVALVCYPVVEFIFNGKLTIYSAVYACIIIFQMILCVKFAIANKDS